MKHCLPPRVTGIGCTVSALCLLLLGGHLRLHAQPNYPVPSGVYCSCGPTNATGPGSVDPAIASRPYVRGILVRIGWNLVEPQDGAYNWAQLDTQIARACSYGKKVALAVVNGPSAPAWLYAAGARYAVVGAPFNDTIPYPWDPVYLARWGDLIAHLGARYDGDTTVTLVHMTNATANGFEFFLSPTAAFNWNAAGYSDMKVIDSWKQVIDAFNAAFPNHYLDNDFHPVFLTASSSTVPGDSVYAYARRTVGGRYGAFSSWWSQKNTSAYPAQYADLVGSARSTFATVQFAYNGTSDSAAFGAGGMPGALRLAIEDGICYWELWNQDILNPKFDSLLATATCTTTGGIEPPSPGVLHPVFNPDPSSGSLFIHWGAIPGEPVEVSIVDLLGRVVFHATAERGAMEAHIDISGLTRGTYVVRVAVPGGRSGINSALVIQNH
ncbi:MAG TPA: T9SS type A sorting domain-containing protein [Candidatus Kapabacteria bacterium]|nr:T9SS type A sorting domain-containing protein [Candidatus Kapabacteria bacterium]